jgi:hypothetical protein
MDLLGLGLGVGVFCKRLCARKSISPIIILHNAVLSHTVWPLHLTPALGEEDSH